MAPHVALTELETKARTNAQAKRKRSQTKHKRAPCEHNQRELLGWDGGSRLTDAGLELDAVRRSMRGGCTAERGTVCEAASERSEQSRAEQSRDGKFPQGQRTRSNGSGALRRYK